MKRIEKRKKEKSEKELIEEFNEMAGRFDEFWTKLSLPERKKFTNWIYPPFCTWCKHESWK